ncbi:MAG: hypothetical protein DI570_06350 [Phenylobacterium zucineum]|nr:MAG: hypothetical protein DI570_06350 [Phenylobacterium zucineum]
MLRGLVVRVVRRLGEQRRLVGPEFDAAFYRARYPDVAALGGDPLDHFLTHGWREGRDPNPRFSVADYLDSHPDVAATGGNPFVHYLRHGRGENRPTADNLGFRHTTIRDMQPVAARVAAALASEAGVPTGSAAQLAAGLARAGAGGLHVTFSQDDYRSRLGGLQICIQQEAAALARQGRSHLNLHPVGRWPTLRPEGEPARLRVLLDDQDLGVFTPEILVAELGRLAIPADAGSFAIHSLLGHAPDATLDVLAALDLRRGFYWLHDYASLCAGFHLLRDEVEDCGGPPPDSAACGICVFGPARGRHLEAHRRLFERLDLTVVSPAAPTLDTWQKAWPYAQATSVVHPHARLAPRGLAPVGTSERPLNVAFVGHAATHKGWPVFRELALSFGADARYSFMHLGDTPESGLPVAFHPVRVSARQPRAMIEALERLDVDVVLFWPLWRETFSFAAYEAVAAGCALITGPDSGNVAAVVRTGDFGWVLPDEAALAEAFAKGAVGGLSRASRRPTLYDLVLSDMTADLIGDRTTR